MIDFVAVQPQLLISTIVSKTTKTIVGGETDLNLKVILPIDVTEKSNELSGIEVLTFNDLHRSRGNRGHLSEFVLDRGFDLKGSGTRKIQTLVGDFTG